MMDVSRYFSSRAKFRVLETLASQTAPLRLRHVAALSKIPVRSAELALERLRKMMVIRRRKDGRFVLFEFRREQEEAESLIEIFLILKKRRISTAARRFGRRAASTLAFVTDAQELLRRARTEP